MKHVHHCEGRTYSNSSSQTHTFHPSSSESKTQRGDHPCGNTHNRTSHLSWVVGSLSCGYGLLLEVLVELLKGFLQGCQEVCPKGFIGDLVLGSVLVSEEGTLLSLNILDVLLLERSSSYS